MLLSYAFEDSRDLSVLDRRGNINFALEIKAEKGRKPAFFFLSNIALSMFKGQRSVARCYSNPELRSRKNRTGALSSC